MYIFFLLSGICVGVILDGSSMGIEIFSVSLNFKRRRKILHSHGILFYFLGGACPGLKIMGVGTKIRMKEI